ncbi:SDR family NAD(P)-dependent oxidoreductase [Chryseosolibacter indicus]|uniref:SDR family oxidoreductase n=1 Tax=Chryseosolibacter indicus TaxID=2782351 RepID=A0ABS5VU66_9BACT|nr:SDR family oxidoreductase [Chryseosolibacter indicus]MBT1704429.1 SDR family oxidoreductase [Chryseosolibacter indicus]
MENRYVLVTGASTGIGYELAKLFAKNGHNLIIVARAEGDLNKAAAEFESEGVAVFPMIKDLFEPKAPFELYEEIKSKGLTVDILVNNAGQGEYGTFIDTDIERQLSIIQLNIASLTALTHLFLKDMVARNQGKILQLASIGSNFPGPYQSVYHATKSYVLSFTEALVNELKDTDVTITALQPGVTDTDFFNKAGAQNSKLVEDKSKMADPAKVAKDGFEALMKGKDKIVSGLKNKTMVGMSHMMPDTLKAEQIRMMSKEQDDTDSKSKSLTLPVLSTLLLAGLGASLWYVSNKNKATSLIDEITETAKV